MTNPFSFLWASHVWTECHTSRNESSDDPWISLTVPYTMPKENHHKNKSSFMSIKRMRKLWHPGTENRQSLRYLRIVIGNGQFFLDVYREFMCFLMDINRVFWDYMGTVSICGCWLPPHERDAKVTINHHPRTEYNEEFSSNHQTAILPIDPAVCLSFSLQRPSPVG